MNLRIGLLAAFLVAFSGASIAAPTIYFGEDTSTAGTGPGPNSAAARASFESGLTGVGNEDFESQTVGAHAPLVLSFPGSGGTLGATLTGTGYVDNTASAGDPGGANPGRFPTSGDQFWEVTTGSFAISFDSPISAFGFYGTDIGDFVTQQMNLVLTDTGSGTTNIVVPHSLNIANNANASLFWGFIDPSVQYTSVSFTNAGGGDVFAFDDMVIGDAGQITTTPEPGTIALFGVGLAALGLRRRKRAN